MTYTIAVFTISSGTDYIRFDSLLNAIKHIKGDIEHFTHLLPEISLDGITTGEAFINLIEERISKGNCMSKYKFLQMIKKDKKEKSS